MYKSPFKWWVQSVMPVVFDDSLSYYEVLAKLTKYIEGLTGDVQEIEKILGTIEGIEDVGQFTEFLEKIQGEIGDLANLSTQSKTNLVSAINEIALKANIAYYKPPTGIPESDLSQGVQDKLNRTVDATKYIINNRELKAAPSNNSPADLGLGTYSVPAGGIPWDTLSQDVQDRINAGGGGTGGTTDYTDLNNKPQINGHTLNAGNNTNESLGLGTYSKPSMGIPETDLSAEVQEKLNTSGGIADSETSFVATRDYEAGELIYINGVLYKTKYKILNGTNLIPGNNIEATDVSNEIERINSDIEALQSGSGPDSWTLATNVSCDDIHIPTRFFEYFNAIGGENYLFIVTPSHTDSRPYDIKVLKRNGTVVKTETVITPASYAQHRFTFTPNDTGEYYCTIAPHYNEKITGLKVEIEYTQSQGISELWAQVNTASQLEPRVVAVENLANEHQAKLDNLNSAIGEITETYGPNLFNPDQLIEANGWVENNGEYSGTFRNLYNKYNINASSLSIEGGFKENTRYSIRCKYYTNNTPLSSGNIVNLRVYYSDGTDTGVIYFDVKPSWASKTAITAAEKTVEKIAFVFSNNNGGNNIFYLKEFQIAEGSLQPAYEPYHHTAIDLKARANINEVETNLLGALKNTEKIMDVKWKKGWVNANGNISSDNGRAVTIIPSTATRIVLGESVTARIICFNNDEYLGKISISGNLSKDSGNWLEFTDEINLSEIFTKYQATYIGISVTAAGATLTNDADAVAFCKANCSVYAQGCEGYDFVPPYFSTKLTDAIENAKSDMGACGKNGFSFIFTTDNHWNHNDGHSPALIKAIQKATNIQDVVLGGDLIDGGSDKAHELKLLQNVASKFVSSNYRLHYIFGNHDSNTVGQTATPALHLSNGEVFMATQHPQKYISVYSNDGFVDYYWDDDTTKTRVIVVDSKLEGIDIYTSQINWFNEALSSTPSDYRIIVMMHIWYGASAIANQGQQIFDAVDDWNAEHDTKVVAMFGGHAHRDAQYKTPSGVPLILTTCDFPTSTLLENVNAQAVDIITVNYTAKKINCRRVGRGNDREITWE